MDDDRTDSGFIPYPSVELCCEITELALEDEPKKTLKNSVRDDAYFQWKLCKTAKVDEQRKSLSCFGGS